MVACSKNDTKTAPPTPVPPILATVDVKNILLNEVLFDNTLYGTVINPSIKVKLQQPVLQSSVPAAVSITDISGSSAALNISYQNGDSVIVVQPAAPLQFLSAWYLKISTALKWVADGSLGIAIDKNLFNKMNSSENFPTIPDAQLLTN